MTARADGAITIQLKLDGKTYDVGLDKATGKTQAFGNQTQKTAADVSQMEGAIKGAAAALGVLAAVKVGSGALNSARLFERLNAQLVTLEGNEAGAKRAFALIREFATQTPFQLDQVTTAYIKLKNLGLDPSERALLAYGDTAAGMGKDLDQLIEAVADASVGEFERLKEFGIKTAQEGDKVKFTFRGVTTEVKKDSASIEEFLIKLGETQFAGGMARQMETVDGALSNLEDSLVNAGNTFAGESGFTQLFAGAVRDLSQTINDSEDDILSIGENVTTALAFIADSMTGIVVSADVGFGTVGRFFRALGKAQAAGRLGGDGLAVFKAEMAGLADDSEDGVDRIVASFGKFRERLEEFRNNRDPIETPDAKTLKPGDQESGTDSAAKDSLKRQLEAETSLRQAFRDRELQLIQDQYTREQEILIEREERLNAQIFAKIENQQLADQLVIENARLTALELQRIDNERAAAQAETDRKSADDRIQNQRVILAASSRAAESLAGIVEASSGKQSKAYRALFAISKGFALSEALLSLQQAIGKANALGFPANVPAISEAISIGGGVVSTISGLKYGGGRASGGRVNPNSFYEVGEGDLPELMRVGNRSYLIPGNRGATVQASQAAQAAAPMVNVNFQVIDRVGVDVSTRQRQEGNQLTVETIIDDFSRRGPISQAVETHHDAPRRGF